jgi:hypothetical protein
MYVLDIRKGNVRPNILTWSLWALAPMIAFSAQLAEGAGLRAVHTFSTGFGPLLIVITALLYRKSLFKVKKRDYIFGLLSLAGIILWKVTGEGSVAIVFAILADFFAAVPTIEKLYLHPETENGWIFGLGFVGALIALLTIKDWRFEEFGFSMYILLVNCVMFAPTALRSLMPNRKDGATV